MISVSTRAASLGQGWRRSGRRQRSVGLIFPAGGRGPRDARSGLNRIRRRLHDGVFGRPSCMSESCVLVPNTSPRSSFSRPALPGRRLRGRFIKCFIGFEFDAVPFSLSSPSSSNGDGLPGESSWRDGSLARGCSSSGLRGRANLRRPYHRLPPAGVAGLPRRFPSMTVLIEIIIHHVFPRGGLDNASVFATGRGPGSDSKASSSSRISSCSSARISDRAGGAKPENPIRKTGRSVSSSASSDAASPRAA